MKRFLSVFLLLGILIPAPAALAQRRAAADSSVFRPSQLIAPGLLIGSGVGIHCFGHDAIDVPVNDWFQNEVRAGGPALRFDDWIQYVPITMDMGLGLLGVPAEHGFVDRFIEGSLSCLMLGIVSGTMKKVIDSPRPGGGRHNSFPSGHTDWVFVGATLVRLEYGWGWGAGAYAIATTVAVMRNYNNRHWLSDCLCGAGLGILAAHAGRWLLEPTKNALGIRTGSWGNGRHNVQASIAPVIDPYSGTVCTALALRF